MKGLYRTCLILVVAGNLFGCALNVNQRAAAAGVAQASVGIGDVAAKEFGHFRSATIEMNSMDVVLGGHAKADNLDGAMDPERVIDRVRSAQALSNYGKLLFTLVEDSEEAEVRQATDAFLDSFSAIGGRHMSDAQLDGLGRLVQGIGYFWVEAQKAKAVKQIVPAAREDVNALCDLLISDLSPQSAQLAMGFETTIRQLRQDAEAVLEDPVSRSADRLTAVDGLRRTQEERAHLDAISAQAVAALRDFKQAHEGLVESLLHDRFSLDDVRSLGKQMNSLRTAMQALGDTD